MKVLWFQRECSFLGWWFDGHTKEYINKKTSTTRVLALSGTTNVFIKQTKTRLAFFPDETKCKSCVVSQRYQELHVAHVL